MDKTAKHLVEQRMVLAKGLATAEKELRDYVLAKHGEYRIGDVAEHCYHGGGTFEVDEVECRIVFREAGSPDYMGGVLLSDRAVAHLYYHGYAHKLGGGLGKRRVTRFGDTIALTEGGAQ